MTGVLEKRRWVKMEGEAQRMKGWRKEEMDADTDSDAEEGKSDGAVESQAGGRQQPPLRRQRGIARRSRRAEGPRR